MDPREESLLAQMLQSAADTIDKPDRVARGLISTALNYGSFGRYGKADPRAILNIIPFSDTLGWTDPKKELHVNEAYFGNKPSDGSLYGDLQQGLEDAAYSPFTYLSWGGLPGAKMAIKAPSVLSNIPIPNAIKNAPDYAKSFFTRSAGVAPDAMNAAAKIMPDITPTLNSTAKGFNDMGSAGINAMENISGLRGNPLGSSSSDTFTNSMKDFPYGDLLKKIEPEVVPVVVPKPEIKDYIPSPYDYSDSYYKAAANAAPNAPKVVKVVDPTATIGDTVEKMPRSFLDSLDPFDTERFGERYLKNVFSKNGDDTFDYASTLAKTGGPSIDPTVVRVADEPNYSQFLGRVDPEASTIGSFSKVADDAAGFKGLGDIGEAAKIPTVDPIPAVNSIPAAAEAASTIGKPVIDDFSMALSMPFNYLESGIENSFAGGLYNKVAPFAGKVFATQVGNYGEAAPVFGRTRDMLLETAPKVYGNMEGSDGASLRSANSERDAQREDDYLRKLNNDEDF